MARQRPLRRLGAPALAIAAVGGAWVVATPAAQTRAVVVAADRIYTVTRGVLDDAEILVEDGRIRMVGDRVPAPAGAARYRAAVVIPGLIDAHTHVALDRSTRPAGPVTAEWRAVEHLNLDDPILQVALSGGMTSLVTRPGSGVISSGQAVALKLGRAPHVLKPFVDLKMAVRPLIGLRPGETPATVMGWYATASEYFRRAREYLEARAAQSPTRIPRDERLEAFAAVLRGDAMLHAHSNYPSEIMMVLRLAREFGFLDRLALGHAGEAHAIADVIARTPAIPVVGPVMIVRFFGDERSHNVVKDLVDAGVRPSVQTDQGRHHLRDFREYGAFLVRHGLSEDAALEVLTINGARAMMLADRIGSIEPGKDADLVLLDGPPFDLTADRVERVLVEGVLQYERPAILQPAPPTPVGPFRPMRGQLTTDDTRFALTNAHVFTVTDGTIANATLVVDNGSFSEIRPGEHVPRDMPVLDVGGRVVLPGWVTGRAFPNDWIGDIKWQVQNDETLQPVVPEMNARFGIDPWFPSFPVIRGIGITAQHISPGHANLIGGSGVVIKTAGMDVDAMVRREPTSLVFSLTRESIRRWAGDSQVPVTLEAAAGLVRKVLSDARQYHAASATRPFDPRLEALGPVLRREVPAVLHATRVDEIREALRIAQDFNLRPIISGGVEAHSLASELAQAGAGVILGDSASRLEDIRGGHDGYRVEAPAILSRHGVRVAFFGPSGSRRGMPTGRLGGEPALNAAWAFRNGTSEADALRMVTINAAELFDVADRLGSIEVGKDADFIVLAGHPFDYRVLPDMVFVDGRLVHRGAF